MEGTCFAQIKAPPLWRTPKGKLAWLYAPMQRMYPSICMNLTRYGCVTRCLLPKGLVSMQVLQFEFRQNMSNLGICRTTSYGTTYVICGHIVDIDSTKSPVTPEARHSNPPAASWRKHSPPCYFGPCAITFPSRSRYDWGFQGHKCLHG